MIEKEKLYDAIKHCWAKETCHPEYTPKWSPNLPSFGQCAMVSLLIQEIYGGKIVFDRTNSHVWNVLDNGDEIDLTRDQFTKGEVIKQEGEITREDMLGNDSSRKAKVKERYEIYRKKVLDYLGIDKF